MICSRCGGSAKYTRRNLCMTCYFALRRTAELDQYPSKRACIPLEGISDPDIRWFFLEARAQGKAIADIAKISGITSSTIRRWKSRCNPSFFDFKCAVEALGYEIRMMAKEPKNVEAQTTD